MTPEESRAKVSTETVHRLDYGDFEEIVNSVYGTDDYSFASDEECGNDTSQSYGGMKKEPIDSYDQDGLDKFKETGQGNYMARVLLQDLVNNDYLPEGDFIIDVCW